MIFVTRCAGCAVPGVAVCPDCTALLGAARAVRLADGTIAAAPFVGVVRELVVALKYRNHRRVARCLAGALEPVVVAEGIRPDLITWAPTSARRAARRGFDQAELLARELAQRLGVPCRRLLRRSAGGSRRSQTGLDRLGRLTAPGFRARVPPGCDLILVVDDVVTTGATLRAAADSLRAAGARQVRCVAAAATPPGRSAWRPGATAHR